jgi:hypothetical protein
MSEYNIPGDAEELFTNGEEQYSIIDPEQSGDNIFAMRLFLEYVGVPDDMVVEDNETQVIVCNGPTRLCIDAYGLGDFYLHGYDVSVVK